MITISHRKQTFAALSFFAAAAILFGNSGISQAQDNCSSRGYFNGYGRGTGASGNYAHRTIHGWGLFKKDPCIPGQPTRYFDSTGRWTGDGVDTMATPKRVR